MIDLDLGTATISGSIEGNTGTDTLEVNSDNGDASAAFSTLTNFENLDFTGDNTISLTGSGTSINPAASMI
jgi:hypothetical protein